MFGFRKKPVGARIPIDPFAMWPDRFSRIAGLGSGPLEAYDNIAFHTPYLPFGRGTLSFQVEFQDLVADTGVLSLTLLVISPAKPLASVIKRGSVALDQLAAGTITATISVRSQDDAMYALCGRVSHNCDAKASRLTIFANRAPDDTMLDRKLDAARSTIFAPMEGDGTPLLVVDTAATLAHPTSQMCTDAQFEESDYTRWLARFNRAPHRHRKQWEHVFICRAFEHVGALRPLNRALGFGCGIEPIPAALAAHNIFVTATDLPAGDVRAENWRHSAQLLLGLDDLRNTGICDPSLFDQRVELRAIDMTTIPDDARDYDLCWSSCALEHLGSIDAGLDFIERSLDTLKPGGIAVHTTELNLTSNDDTIESGGTVLFRRCDIERLANRLLAQGHTVFPITFDMGDQPNDRFIDIAPYEADVHLKLALGLYVSTSFGLIIRKRG